jgi:phage-related protein
MIQAAQLKMTFDADTQGAHGKIAALNNEMGNTGGMAGKASAGLLGFIAGGAAVNIATQAIGFLTSSFGGLIQAGEESQAVDAQTAAVLKSTKGAAGLTAQAVSDLATKLSTLSGVDDEAVQGTENLLLTFTKIGSTVMPQATQAVLDMATSMNHGALPTLDQMNSYSIMVGKALNDPIKGVTALTKVGVTFTEQQKAAIAQMIKTGDIAGAQKIILGELGTEFGGSAEAAGGTFAGALAKLNVMFGNMQETIAKAIMPVLLKLMTAIQPAIIALGEKLPGAMDTLMGYIQPLVDKVAELAAWMTNTPAGIETAKGALLGIGVAIAVILIPIMYNLAAATIAATWPFLLVAAAIAGIVFAVKYAYDNFKPFRDIVQQVGAAIQTGLGVVIPWLQQAFAEIAPKVQAAAAVFMQFAGEVAGRLGPMLSATFSNIQTALKVLMVIWMAVWPGFQQVIAGVWEFIQGYIQVAWSLISGIIKIGLALLSGDWAGAWKALQEMVSGVWSGIQKMISGALNIIVGYLRAWGGAIMTVLGAVWGWLVSAVSSAWHNFTSAISAGVTTAQSFVSGMASNIVKLIQGLPGKFLTIGANIIGSLLDALKNGAGRILSFLGDLAGQMLSKVKGVFGIASPSREMAAIGGHLADGLVNGLKGGNIHVRVAEHLSSLGGVVSNAVRGSSFSAHVLAATTDASGGMSSSALHHAGGAHPSALHSGQSVQGAAHTSDGTPVNLVLDGQVVGRLLMPHIVAAARRQGIRL